MFNTLGSDTALWLLQPHRGREGRGQGEPVSALEVPGNPLSPVTVTGQPETLFLTRNTCLATPALQKLLKRGATGTGRTS